MTGEGNTGKNANKKNKGNRFSGIAAFSLFIALFDRLGALIYDTFLSGFFGKIFTSYTALNQKMSDSLFKKQILKNGKFKAYTRKAKKKLASKLESCLTLSLTSYLIETFCSLPLQYYGNFGIFFGLYTMAFYFVKLALPWFESPDISHLAIGTIITVASIPLMLSRINLANSVKNSIIGRGIFKKAFGFSDEVFDNKKTTKRGKWLLTCVTGLIIGIATLFIHPIYVLVAILAIVVITLIAYSPEIGVLISIFVLPFLSLTDSPTIMLAIIVLVTAFFYIIKLIRGKRLFKLEILDFAILSFGIYILLSSIFSAGGNASVFSAIISFILLLGYFLLVNLMRTTKWIKRCILTLITSSVIVSIIGIFEFIFSSESTNWLDQSFYGIIKTRVISLFGNPNMLAIFLVMVFPFIIALSLRATEKNDKFLARTLILLFIFCIIFTWSRAAWIAIIVGTIFFAILYTKKSFRIFGALLLIIPLIPILLPTSIIERFLSIADLSDSSISYRIYTWQGTLKAIRDYSLFGIGYGDSAFQAVYPSYAYSGIEATPHSHSLLLQILLCMGVIGFILFFAAIFLNFQKSFEHIKNEKSSTSNVYIIASAVSIASALIMGIFDYVWYNQRMFYLFWIIIAIGTAFVRVGDSERLRREPFEHTQSLEQE